MSRLKKYLPDFLIFASLILIGIKISWFSRNITDVDSFDESIYLYRGITLNPFISHHLDGFFYYLWYKIFSVFAADNAALYFLNNSILLGLPGLLIFIFLRTAKVNLLISFFAASIFLISSANVFVIPFITKFALCVILAGLIIIYRITSPLKKLQGTILLSLILIYIRPEFILTLFVSLLIYLILLFKNFRTGSTKYFFGKLLPVILIIPLMFFFNPVSRHRANVAFAQHYAKDLIERGATSQDPTIPDEVMKEHFSTDLSMWEAFNNNPKLFLEHIGFNILRLNEHIADAFPYFIIQNGDSLLRIFFHIFFTALLLVSFYFFFERIRNNKIGIYSLIFLLFFLPPFVSALIFYPRVHYMIFVIAFILIYSGYELSKRAASYPAFKKFSVTTALILGLCTAIFLPFRGNSGSIHDSSCTILHTAQELNKFRFNDNVNFFAVGPGIMTFLNNDWKYVSDELLVLPADHFMQKNNVNLILVNNFFFNHPLIKNNNEIDKILKDTGFAKIDIPGCLSFVLARKDILK